MRKRIQKSTRRYNKGEGSVYSSSERKPAVRSNTRFSKDTDTREDRGERKKYNNNDERPFKPRGKSFDKPTGEIGVTRFSKKEEGDSGNYREKKSFGNKPFKPRGKSFDKPAYKQRGDEEASGYKGKKNFDNRGERPFKPRSKSFDRPSGERGANRFSKKEDGDAGYFREKKSFVDKPFKPRAKSFDKPPYKERGGYKSNKNFDDREERSFKPERRSFDNSRDNRRTSGFEQRGQEERSNLRGKKNFDDRNERPFKPRGKSFDKPDDSNKNFRRDNKQFKSFGRNAYSKSSIRKNEEVVYDGTSRLNKYVANSGICSRREADDLITAGLITVNGELVTELGTKVKQGDVVRYNGATIRNEVLRYVLLNKPKDFITTTDDPQNRRTVMELISKACKERVYPVGRLDRNTTGVLLFTNDGDLAKKLMHPGSQVQKIYHVELDKKLSADDMETIRNGIELEDGFAKVDSIEYDTDFADKSQIGVELHSGKNRIVRRIFESLGYAVVKLDRVIFAGLTKKDLPRGRWRFLSEIEVSNLKMITGKSKQK